MTDFAIITPTIGRDVLNRCLMTMKHQVHKNFIHLVIGDGPQELWVRKASIDNGCQYFETPKEGCYGVAQRNYALDLLESGRFGEYRYVLFLDDDNILLEPALYNAQHDAGQYGYPAIMWQDILFTNKYKTEYHIMPASGVPFIERDWDALNGFYRHDIIRGVRTVPAYNQDFQLVKALLPKAGNHIAKIRGVGGVHCLSWDTWEQHK